MISDHKNHAVIRKKKAASAPSADAPPSSTNKEKRREQWELYQRVTCYDSNKALQCYSRDPSSLFLEAKKSSSSSSSSSSGLPPKSRCQQPVKYRNIVLAVPVGHLPAGTAVYGASVDWHQGSIAVYASASDAINCVAAASCDKLPLLKRHASCCCYQDAMPYVRETFAFLLRGHSLFHPQCLCSSPNQPQGRAAELGFQYDDLDSSSSACTVGTMGTARSVSEIERELGVRSLQGLVWAGGEVMPLLDVLVRLAGLTVAMAADAATIMLSSPLCCIPATLSTGEDIVAAAKALYPRPVLCKHDTWCRDIARMQQEGAIRVLPAAEGCHGMAVFWRPEAEAISGSRLFQSCSMISKAVDKDLRELWFATAISLPKDTPTMQHPSGSQQQAPKKRARVSTARKQELSKKRQILTLF